MLKKDLILDKIQRFIALTMALFFLAGLIPFFYANVYEALVVLISIQIIISLIRLDFFNLTIELIIFVLIFFSAIPLLGYIFRIVGIVLSLIDSIRLKVFGFYKNFSKSNFHPKKQKNKLKTKKKNDFKEAEFREK